MIKNLFKILGFLLQIIKFFAGTSYAHHRKEKPLFLFKPNIRVTTITMTENNAKAPIMKNRPLLLFFFALLFIAPAFGQQLTKKGIEETPPPPPVPQEALWTRSLEVETGIEQFQSGAFPSYTITIYDTDERMLERIWKNEVKRKSDKFSNKKDMVALQTKLPIHDEPLDIHATFDYDKRDNTTRMHVTFLQNGEPIDTENNPEAHAATEKMMYDLAVKMNQAVVLEQIEEQEKIQKDLERDLDRLRRDNEKLHNSILKNQQRIEKAQSDQASLEREIEYQKERIDDFEEQTSDNRTSDNLKELSKLRNALSKMEKKISDLISDQRKYENEIREAEEAIPVNEVDQEKKIEEIEQQRFIVEKYREKYNEIN